ncbi:SDR family oxidoreductase [Streptomyces sp. NPDC035033]|uniref:SDR family NAD(P)-dependent oxidoreductase n=1 Tax=Streptomyces sp. NPDC035033 TaxID=3155368 RepID=UPI0033F64648
MDLGLNGRTVLVTAGSGDGVGSATARAFAAEGARVAITYHTRPEAARAVARDIETLGGEALVLPYALGDLASVEAAVETVLDRWGSLDALVANATYGPVLAPGPFEEVPPAAWQPKMRSDIGGTYRTTQLAVAAMRKTGWGRIVYVSSTGWVSGRAGRTAYQPAMATTKAALHGLARSLAVELGRDGILVNVVSPGAIDGSRLRARLGDQAVKGLAEASATGRISRPEDVAAAIVFLCSTANQNITGIDLPVDGASR